MKLKIIMILAICLSFTSAYAVEPVPFVCDGQAYTVRNSPANFYRIDQSDPFVFTPIGTTLQGPFGATGSLIPIGMNNIGYRLADDLVYGVAEPPGGTGGNYGLVQLDNVGNVFPVSTNPDIAATGKRFLAGDIDPVLDVMYLNTWPLSSIMYIVNLSSEPASVAEKTLYPPTTIRVADWAVNPIDGYLYGADYTPDSVIYKLDPTDGSVSNLGHPEGLPAGVAYGGAWFNAAGVLFVFRNNDEIYQIDVTQSPPEMLNSLEGETDSSTYNDAAACAVYDTPGPPSSDKYYTYTNNNWAERCVEYDIEENCISWRQANIDLDEGVFAAPLPQNDDDEFVLLGKEIGTKKTVVNPGQYFAVVNVEVTEEQDVLVEENFSDCLDIGTVNPFSVPGGVQVVLIDESGDVYQIDGDLAQDIGGYITLTEGTVDVFVEAVPANSTLRVMVKFQPSDAVGIISSSCTNTADISDGGEESPIATASAGLVIQER